jgi:hypothetical protein
LNLGAIPLPRSDRLEDLCRAFGVGALYAFGSRSRECLDWLSERISELAPGPSDVDVGILPLPGSTWSVREKVRFAVALEDFVECNRVDVVFLPEADPFVAVEVIRGERLFTADEDRSDEYELYLLRRAGDLAPLEAERQELILRRRP